jgi:FAD synthase
VFLLNSFLKIPLEIGWTQESYFYKNGCYKINLNILENNYKLILQDIGQQDLPFPGDKLSNRIEAYILDLKINDKHRKVEVEKIASIKNSS